MFRFILKILQTKLQIFAEVLSMQKNERCTIFEEPDVFNHAVPLGSIPELPAESCSEIKASEGNEMVNGDYWIYSDGNGQTILARCEGKAF